MDEVFGLFPTPFMRAPATLNARLVEGLVQHFSALASSSNKASGSLLHTEMLHPGDSPLLVEAAQRGALGAVALDGRMIDAPVAARARKLLDRHTAIAARAAGARQS